MRRVLDVEEQSGRIRIRFAYDVEVLQVVRALPGRRYDSQTRSWTVPLEHLGYVVRRLEVYEFSHTARLTRFWHERGPQEEVALPAVPEGTWTVSALNQAAQQALKDRFAGSMWIVGELQGFDKNRGGRYSHFYFDLVERPVAGAQEVARISAIAFEGDMRQVEAQARAHNIELRDGVVVRLRCKVDLYQRSGRFQIVVDGIDATYTVGELELNRDRVFQGLKRQGIEGQNLELVWPLCPLRVGLITSHGSDAYQDFIHQLKQSGRGFSVTVHHANVQGVHTESSVLRALRYFEERADEFDVVAIIRGGGSRSDLAYFDTEAIGEAVCRHPLKVICGVGHQADISLLDLIAHSTKTPTAAAEELCSRVAGFVERVEGVYRRIGHLGELRLGLARQRLLRDGPRLEREVRARLGQARREQDQKEAALIQGARMRVEQGRRVEGVNVERLAAGSMVCVRERRASVEMIRQELSLRRFGRDFLYHRGDLRHRFEELERAVRREVAGERQRLDQVEERLRLLDPRRILERGFAIVHGEQGVIRSQEGLRVGESFDIVLADGKLRAKRLEDEPRQGQGARRRSEETAQEQG